jgi:hypothetical protein
MTFEKCTSPTCEQVRLVSVGLPWAATATTTTAGVENGNGRLDVTNGTTDGICKIFGIDNHRVRQST